MKRQKTIKKKKSIEESLWKSAKSLRGSVESSEYKHVVLSLIFLKFVSDKFENHRKKLVKMGQEKYLEMSAAYIKDNIFYIPESSRWSYIQSRSKEDGLALKIDTALKDLEKTNNSLIGALPNNYFSGLDLERSNLSSLVDKIGNIDTVRDEELDIIGRVYEYFLRKFAIAEGKGKGEFYTPKSIVKLIAELIQPYKGKVYDPCCGSGGMYVQCLELIRRHHGNTKDLSIYGQEKTSTTYKLAKMNLAIRGITSNLGIKAADTFHNDQHKTLKADFIMANPPFNQENWRENNELVKDSRWEGFNTPPLSNANYGWILHMVSKLSEDGIAGFILANGALSGDREEQTIRKQLIEKNLIEAIIILPRNMFYSTDISVTLWIINKNKKEKETQFLDKNKSFRNREKEVLFMDLRQMGEPFEKKYIQLNDEHRKTICKTYHDWQQVLGFENYENIPEYCYSASTEEIRSKDYSLVPSKYIKFINRDENINFDEYMESIRTEFRQLLFDDENSKKELLSLFEEIGYEIKL